MERRTPRALALFSGMALLIMAPCWAAATADPPAAKTAAAKAEKPAAKDAASEQQKMMEAMAKAGTPGMQQQDLAKHAGSWDLAVKAWMAPGAPPQESKATADRTMILGGRVLTEKVNGEAMGGGGPFEGFGMAGYDNVSGKYWSTWVDNMSTGVWTSTGSCSEKTSVCTYSGSYTDPMTKKAKHTRTVEHWEGADKAFVEFYEAGKGGKETKTMEITYTRKK